MLDDLRNLEVLAPADASSVVSGLVIALTCGILLGWMYRLSYRGTSYSPAFVRSMIVLPMITALVILVIGNNLARAFGLVGAMSIIRFRTAVKDIHDIMFIFFSLAVGLAAGVGMYAGALVGTALIGATIMITTRADVGHVARNALLLEFHYRPNGDDGPPAYQETLARYSSDAVVLSVKQREDDGALAVTMHVELRSRATLPEVVRSLGQTPGVSAVRAYYDDEEL